MSRPYQFTEESSRSPLDPKPQAVFQAGQPPSFKTNVNRMKTKRWVEAKSFSYDGDDWGEYDEYDEYGANDQPAPPTIPTAATGLRQKGQGASEPGRSFTDPQAAGQPPPPRKHSFDAGDERRAFSAAMPPPVALNQKAPIDTAQNQARNGTIGEASGASPVTAPAGQQPMNQYPANNGQRPPVAVQIPAIRQTSAAQSDASDTPQHRRDFSPSALPPPLQTRMLPTPGRMSPTPGSATASPGGTRFPARKSSLSHSSPSEPSGSPFTRTAPSNIPSAPSREGTPSNAAKPLPFIRPADIYKRVNEEREKERQSMDSSRPSLDSLMSRPGEDGAPSKGVKERASSESLGRANGRRLSLERLGDSYETGRTLQPMLESVAERKSEYLPDFSISSQGAQSTATQPAQSFQSPPTANQPKPLDQAAQTPALPQVQRLSTFGDDFWSSATASGSASSPATGNETSNRSPYGDPGFRSVVDQAFNRTDDRSMPPTPISKQTESESGVSRSNTDSTSGISPIMSRVPSSATSALKARNAEARETSTPVIAEEASETNTPPSRPLSAAMLGGSYQIPRKPSPAHSRNVSGGSTPGPTSAVRRSGLDTPSPADSPARSPAVEAQKSLPEPAAAVISSLSPTSPSNVEGAFGAPSTNYATREADIASAMRGSPEKEVPGLGEVEKETQIAFLESHKDIKAPTFERPPRSRSGSPSKGRVQELAGRFNEISESRRNSNHSIASKGSVSSWERSQEDLTLPGAGTQGLASKGKHSIPDTGPVGDALAERPVVDRGVSFRPKLPGQWESYTTAATPSEAGDSNVQLGQGDARIAGQGPLGTSAEAIGEADEEIDLTPTTTKHPVAVSDPSIPTSNPLAALQAAGNAMGEAIKASMGMGKSPSDAEMERDAESKAPAESHSYSVGDVYLRPLQLDRAASSVASSAPPTPPPKDSSFELSAPESEDMPPPVPLKQKSPEPSSPTNNERTPTRPTILPQLSTDPSLDDQESDKLRKEIVMSLSPVRGPEAGAPESSRSSLQPNFSLVNNRDSSILPAEYESYWADGGMTSQPPVPFKETTSGALETVPEVSGARMPAELASTAAITSHPTSGADRPGLLSQRFSFESDPNGLSPQPAADEQTVQGVELPQAAREEHKASSPTLRLVEEEPLNKLYLARTASSGPAYVDHTVQPTPGVVGSSEIPSILAEASTGTSQAQNAREPTPPGKLPTGGLHVVNSENPEAVDLPLRLSAEIAQKAPPTQPQSPSHDVTPMGPRPQTGQAQSSQPNAIMDKPPGFREILAIKSSSDRITTYNLAREHFARSNTGLNKWLLAIAAVNPDPTSLGNLATRPTVPVAGPSRHKPTGSISLFSKLATGNSQQPQAAPYFEQYNTAASQLPTQVRPSTPTATPQGNQQGVSGASAGGKSTGHQMQAKGKDLLHTAGVLGGKATIGAKGLFAKGKSRFRSSGSADKVDN
ncbi:hypothetical protein AOQ84DRAFT_370920 [Glonium stellatum]|uniref:Uncharacterized protein n=1 Tax=Glonium stellatum TaxID=574774 RepID=A0A8E2JZG6_9PEZI|nr:hypothetical protein AOQ84DRAFT_370920 [Glonium stellatum]